MRVASYRSSMHQRATQQLAALQRRLPPCEMAARRARASLARAACSARPVGPRCARRVRRPRRAASCARETDAVVEQAEAVLVRGALSSSARSLSVAANQHVSVHFLCACRSLAPVFARRGLERFIPDGESARDTAARQVGTRRGAPRARRRVAPRRRAVVEPPVPTRRRRRAPRLGTRRGRAARGRRPYAHSSAPSLT